MKPATAQILLTHSGALHSGEPTTKPPPWHFAKPLLRSGAFAIGAMGVVGFFLHSATIAGVLPGGGPVAALTGVALMFLCIAATLRPSPQPSRSRLGSRLASIVGLWAIAEIAASLIQANRSEHVSVIQGVPIHPYPVTSVMLLVLCVVTLTSARARTKVLSHILASAVLLSCIVFLFGIVYRVPWFADLNVRVFPVLATTLAFLMLSAASLLTNPMGWAAVLLSQTGAGQMSRLLLPATIVLPLLTALVVQARAGDNYLSGSQLTIVAAVNMLCITGLILAGGALIARGDAERLRFAAIVESSADAIYAKSLDGTILSWNQGAERIYGYSATEAIGANASMLFADDSASEPDTVIARLERGERIEPFDTVRICKDGTRAELSLTVSPIRNSEGRLEGVATIGRDIRAQKAAANALRASEARFRSLTDSNILGIMFWNRDGTVVGANGEFLRVTGYSRSDVDKGVVSWAAITPPEAAAEGQQKLREVLSVGWVAPFEKECLRIDGGRVPVLFGAAAAADNEGIAFLLDITDRKRAERLQMRLTGDLERAVAEHIEELRRRAEELESTTLKLARSNRELEAFTYSVSHDLRAPLRSMDGFSRILMDEYIDRLDDRAAGYLMRIRKAAERMSHLIDDLLSLSRISRHEIRASGVDLSALARSVADELEAAEPGRRVTWGIADGIQARGDAPLLRIALQNLIGNAWKFSSKKSAARIEFSRSDSTGEYFVRDDGAGFDPRHSDKLFAPFQRLHSASDFEGTGIGLALVERIVTRHGGTVRAEGAPGQGATFYFSLGEGKEMRNAQ